MNAEALKSNEIEELDEFGELVRRAFKASGQPPSANAVESAVEQIELPESVTSPAGKERFYIAMRERLKHSLQEDTGAPTLGAFIRVMRIQHSVSEAAAAQMANLPLPAYLQLEAGRMPVWRAPAPTIASFCKALNIDTSLLLRWASLELAPGAAFGRIDITGEDRTAALGSLGRGADQAAAQDFEKWRQTFISASGAASADSSPSGR